jgi:hypothetical protein
MVGPRLSYLTLIAFQSITVPPHAAPYGNMHNAPPVPPPPMHRPERSPYNQGMVPPVPAPNPNVGGPGANLPRNGENQIHIGNVSQRNGDVRMLCKRWQDLIDLFRHSGTCCTII